MTPENISKDQHGLDEELLAILCCPETKQDIAILDQNKLKILNEKIKARELQNKGGSLVKEELDGALLRADQTVVYPIHDAIPIMLIDEGIDVKGFF